jgi:hypothetical protein
LLHFSGVIAQNKYWQQEVNFNITVTLNDKEHTLDAFESVEYINNSPDTLRLIWFHIWPNAYKNDRTAFSEQLLKEGRTDFYFSKQNQKGYINQLDFKVDGASAYALVDTNNIDIVKILLPSPLPPGKNATITTPFKVRLPFNFSRGGHIGNSYQVTQWFPKPAVYDKRGWHPMPYLDQGEFYSEFGKYDVEITVPSAYVVAGTGVLQDEQTLKQLKENGKHTAEGATKMWHYKQNNIHDFAWFASKNFVVKYDTAQLPSGKVVDVFSYYQPKAKGWEESVKFAKDGLKKYSSWLGDYPYTIATVVDGSANVNSGGMEYPTITLITTPMGGKELDITIAHELGHNWFYGALATNEREHPWMDEGMNSFYERRYKLEKYPGDHEKVPFKNKIPGDEEELLLAMMYTIRKDQPITTTSTQASSVNYVLGNYVKAPIWLKHLEDSIGATAFNNAMRHYYSEWKFKHPYPEDFKASLEKALATDLGHHFNYLYQAGPIGGFSPKKIKPTFLFNLKDVDKYNYINIAPAIGYNFYDKGMIGGMLNNYLLPLTKFQFVAGALYATRSKKVNPFGRIAYTVYKRTVNVSTALSYISYTINDFKTDDNQKLYMGVQRWVPSVGFTFFSKDANNTRKFNVEWKTFILKEGLLDFNTVISGADTSDVISVKKENTAINRLSLGISDSRILFPYSINVVADQGKDFLRTGLTVKYYFNYPDGKTGMSARFFAGKFFYLKQKTFLTRYNNDRYLLNLSAPKGYEDYTYSDYFVGRNEFEGWRSQQVMERDGFFKVNTELLSDKVGKTDNWLMALNLSTSLPDNINPLSVLPFKIPFKLFVDVGTYAEAWKENPATGRFVYDAGIEFPLLSSLIHVYVPLIYSKVYSNYYKSTLTENRFLKTISFTIDINQMQLKNLIKQIPL